MLFNILAVLSCTLLAQGVVVPYSSTEHSLTRRQFGGPDSGSDGNQTAVQVINNLDQTSFYLSEIRNASIGTNETGLRAMSSISSQLVDLARDSSLLAIVVNSTENGNTTAGVPVGNTSLPALFGNPAGTAQAALVSLNASVSSLQDTLSDPTNSTTVGLITQAQQAVSLAWVAFGASIGQGQGQQNVTSGEQGGNCPTATTSATSAVATDTTTTSAAI